MSEPPGRLERILLRERTVVITALCLIVTSSWIYILSGAGMSMSAADTTSISLAVGLPDGTMKGPPGGMANTMAAMATPTDWTFNYALLMFFMWWVMMIAMMLPSAAPMILLHSKVTAKARQRPNSNEGLLTTAAFTAAYLLIWGLFSLIAVSLQWAFEWFGLLSPMKLNSTSSMLAGFILLFAGAYQLTPIKQACLKHCRGPLQFLSQNWRSGTSGAFRLGLHHGAYCFGCCWGLMGILFFGGIMNLYWIVGLSLIVFLEKMGPIGPRLSNITGGLFLFWGAAFIFNALATG
jgi:predicted metal-binding membrane protein